MPVLNALIIFACQDAPTKSRWPVASMLLMLSSSKSSSVWKRGIVYRVRNSDADVFKGPNDLLLYRLTFTQQLPVDGKGCPGNGPTGRRKNASEMTWDGRQVTPVSLPAER